MKRLFIVALGVAAMGTISCSKTKGGPQTSEANSGTALVKKGVIEQVVVKTGTVRSSQRIELRAERKVKISANRVKNFDTIKKGQILSEVDNEETLGKLSELNDRKKTMDLEFQSVKIKHDHANKVLDRKKILFNKGIIAQKEFDEASRDFRLIGSEIRAKELEAEKLIRDLHEAKEQIKSSNFIAPMDGMVTGLVIHEAKGVEVQAGQAVATVSDPSRLALWVGIEESNLHRIKTDMPAEITLDSVPNEKFAGKIISVGTNEVSNGSSRVRMYEVGIGFSAKNSAIREGYTGQVKMSFERKENVLTVPAVSLKYLDGKDYVMVKSTFKGTPTAKLVTVGIRTDNEAEILSGLSEKEEILLVASATE